MPRDQKCRRTVLALALVGLTGFWGCGVGPSPSKSKQSSEPPVSNQVTSIPPSTNQAGDTTKIAAQSELVDEQNRPPQPIFRPDDLRPKHDDQRLAEAGIRVFESKRLKLYTDLDAKQASSLPTLIDQVYSSWEGELGPLPPDRAGTEFQITGYLIHNVALFREYQLIPDELILGHGRHSKNEFWMRDQTSDYYRRQLLIHEATHCYMTFLTGVNAPQWYLEGMAEYFGVHQLNGELSNSFRVIPASAAESLGFGRIEMIRDDIAAKSFQSIPSLFAFSPQDFLETKSYAWSWALCLFLDQTPRYHERFQQLSGFTQGNQFIGQFQERFQADERDLATAWTLFSANLQYGYDVVRATIDFRPGTRLSDDASEHTVTIEADRGWQSSEVLLEADHNYELAATGKFTLADQPKPWLSEPQGITFRYFDGIPLGALLGCLRTEEGPAGGVEESMLKIITIGRGCRLRPEKTATLYLRVNDAWNSLRDNRGQVRVVIRRLE